MCQKISGLPLSASRRTINAAALPGWVCCAPAGRAVLQQPQGGSAAATVTANGAEAPLPHTRTVLWGVGITPATYRRGGCRQVPRGCQGALGVPSPALLGPSPGKAAAGTRQQRHGAGAVLPRVPAQLGLAVGAGNVEPGRHQGAGPKCLKKRWESL